MKNIFCIFIFILALPFYIFAEDRENVHHRAADLTVIVTGLKSNNGEVIIKLYNSMNEYESKVANPFRKISANINEQKAEGVFRGIPFGEYAIKLFHDENGNGEHDQNFLGIPREDYAFSNNARGRFGPPKYEKARFTFKKDITINIVIPNKH